MTTFDDEKKGVLFRHTEKTTPSQPDYRGNCQIGGVEFWLSAWIKESKAGRKYMSLSFTPKETSAQPRPGDDAEF